MIKDTKPISELTNEELFKLKAQTNHKSRISENKPIANIINFTEIERENISWLWPGKIPLRKITMLAGNPGKGKSLVSCDIASIISKGEVFPDGSRSPEGDVIFMTPEDDPGDTIRPRLEAANAELNRCHFLKGQVTTDTNGVKKDRELIKLDLEIIRDAFNQIRGKGGSPLLLIIDPISSYLGGIDQNSSEVREALIPFGEFAHNENIAVLFIKHLNKASGKSAAYRVGGSIEFTAVARSVWAIAEDPEEPVKRLFLPIKNNIGKDTAGLSFYIEEDRTGIPFVKWNGEPETRNIESILSGFNNSNKSGSTEQAEIIKFLQEHGEAKTGDIAEAIGKTAKSTSNMLQKLLNAKKIVRSGYGVYTVPSSSPTQKTDGSDVSDRRLYEVPSLPSLPHGGQLDGSLTESEKVQIEIF